MRSQRSRSIFLKEPELSVPWKLRIRYVWPWAFAALALLLADIVIITIHPGRHTLRCDVATVALMVAAGVLTVVALIVQWRIAATLRRRKLLHLCHSCGYSLMGNVSGACPECGEKLSPGEINRSCVEP
jgi:predicted RNA-binding Zn-ribbon protein involved in translation (DUF1610 family)